MSETACYIAISPKTAFYSHLQQEAAFYVLLLKHFDIGLITSDRKPEEVEKQLQEFLNSDLYRSLDDRSSDASYINSLMLEVKRRADEELKDTIKTLQTAYPKIFRSRAEVRDSIKRFNTEANQAVSDNRYSKLHYYDKISTCLTIEFSKRKEFSRLEARDMQLVVDRLMWGDQNFEPNHAPERSPLTVISVELVQEGAKLLQTLSSEALFTRTGEREELCLEFERWRRMYIAAAEHQEIILVGIAGG